MSCRVSALHKFTVLSDPVKINLPSGLKATLILCVAMGDAAKGIKLGHIIHHARLAGRRTDADEAPAEGDAVAPESPVLTDGREDDDADGGESAD